jgi:hypothetical protein
VALGSGAFLTTCHRGTAVMGPGMFDNLICDLLIMGAAIGLGIAGLIWLGVWIWSHLEITWL